MKRILGLLMALIVCLGVFTLVGGVNTVKAAEDDIASGTNGSCSWVIDADGVLTIGPRNGTSGVLGSGNDYPWQSYRAQIKKIYIEPGVSAPDYIYQLFYNLNNVTEIDASNLNTSNTTNFGRVFWRCSKLEKLNISGWDTRKATVMVNFTDEDYNLTSVTLGPNFRFTGNNITTSFWKASLPTPSAINHTGKWVRDDGVYGPYTSAQLQSNYISTMAGTWIAELKAVPYVVFDSADNTLYFVRSKEAFTNNSTGTVTSISGGTYSGQIFTVNETSTSSNRTWDAVKSQVKKVKFVDEIKPKSVESWFDSFTACTEFDLGKLNTSNVTSMRQMFYNCKSIKSLDLSGFNTSNVTNMYYMFCDCTGLETLDISNFDTRKVTMMGNMFYQTRALKRVKLSENFSFKGKNISSTGQQAMFTGHGATGIYTNKWIREDKAYGPYNDFELRDNYTSEMAGTWVWELKPTEYTIMFKAEDGSVGAMPNVNADAKSDFTIPANQFQKFGYDFDYWVDSSSRTYADKGVIPANRFAAGNTVTLTAVFKKRDTSLNWDGNEAEFSIRGGEQAVLNNIPAGTSYQVYELTPDGWVLVQQENASGVIEALEESSAAFWNKYQPGVTTVQFSGLKNLDGRPADAGKFTFELYEGETLVDTATTQDGGFIQFKVIEYDTAGDHVYTIREVDTNDDTIDYDTHEETVEVSVTDNGDGTLSSEVTYDDDGIVFSNTTRPGTLRITKDATNGTSQNANDEFTIEIEFRNESGMPINDNIYWYVEGGATTPSEISGGNQE